MKKEFYKVILDFSAGSAYQYRIGSEIPTKIEYCRKYAGKYEKGKDDLLNYHSTFDVVETKSKNNDNRLVRI